MKRSSRAWWGAGVLAAALLAACGPVAVRHGERLAQPVVAPSPKIISFEIEPTVFPSLKPSAQRGAEVYQRSYAGAGGSKSCASCHGSDGRPADQAAPDLSTPAWQRDQTPLAVREAFLAATAHAGFDYAHTMSLQSQWDALTACSFLSIDVARATETKTTIFGKNCNVCHGTRGFGVGILSNTMQPQPRNLNDLPWAMSRSDQEIFTNIWYGLPWSAMPPWRGTLTESEVWQVVEFIRTLQFDPPEGGPEEGK